MPNNEQEQETPQTVRQHKIHFYRQIAFTFIGAAIVVLIGLLYFSLSQAVITVESDLEDVKADFHILVKSETDQTEEGIAAQLHTAEIEIERTVQGELLEEGEPQQATGTVTLMNDSGVAQPLVATTRLLSEENVLFRMEEEATVPANGEVEAEVYADEPGKQGEIAPTRFTIPGLNEARQQEVYAVSDEPMTGGTASVYEVTQEAVDTAIEEAKADLAEQGREALEAEGVNVDQLLPDTYAVNVNEQTIEPEVGAEAQQFTVNMTADVAFVEAFDEDLLELAQAQLYSTTSLGYELSSSDEGSFSYEISTFDPEEGIAQIHVVLEGERRISANHPSLDPSNFVGKDPEEVKNELTSEAGIQNVEIELRPFWLWRIPRLVDHIYVQFQN